MALSPVGNLQLDMNWSKMILWFAEQIDFMNLYFWATNTYLVNVLEFGIEYWLFWDVLEINVGQHLSYCA